jgi:hypothetical protein
LRYAYKLHSRLSALRIDLSSEVTPLVAGAAVVLALEPDDPIGCQDYSGIGPMPVVGVHWAAVQHKYMPAAVASSDPLDFHATGFQIGFKCLGAFVDLAASECTLPRRAWSVRRHLGLSRQCFQQFPLYDLQG